MRRVGDGWHTLDELPAPASPDAAGLREDRMAAAIEPWFGEDARTVAILLTVFDTPESRRILAGQLAAGLDDPAALMAALNRVAGSEGETR